MSTNFNGLAAPELAGHIKSKMFPVTSREAEAWRQRAEHFVDGFCSAAVFLRERRGLNLSDQALLDLMPVDVLAALAFAKEKIAEGRDSSAQLEPLRVYLRSLPGFEEQLQEQPAWVQEKHSFITMQVVHIWRHA
jgi:hypothetical protein